MSGAPVMTLLDIVTQNTETLNPSFPFHEVNICTLQVSRVVGRLVRLRGEKTWVYLVRLMFQ